jgi:hypothetical protein
MDLIGRSQLIQLVRYQVAAEYIGVRVELQLGLDRWLRFVFVQIRWQRSVNKLCCQMAFAFTTG